MMTKAELVKILEPYDDKAQILFRDGVEQIWDAEDDCYEVDEVREINKDGKKSIVLLAC